MSLEKILLIAILAAVILLLDLETGRLMKSIMKKNKIKRTNKKAEKAIKEELYLEHLKKKENKNG